MPAPVLEIAVQDVAGVRVAADVGAARVELCAALGATGGLTPSVGLLEAAVGAAGTVGVHPLIRPRAGGFVYDDDELDTQVRDVRAAVRAGAAGVVVGVLTVDGAVDAEAVARLVEAADGREVTFHRAFDVVPDVGLSVDALTALGVTRVLTSGGAAAAADGLLRLGETVRAADGGLQVMAGGGVRPSDVAALAAVGVDAVHLSAKTLRADAAGPGGGADAGYEVTSAEIATAAAEAVRALD
ncbi:copper homeostasis protein [Paraoerskovia marina]|uniref:PF03932 family protein CutC n=1 Tax=Paraoerskovia marina TaxID=545619 RepID=A0A1H1W5L5_9CELL|nr:copper homeostasis protein CutC [Paraoerskovia marina]SDS92334.1 copper homeostasis protein [Paraoerskovia marina]